jgi:hypothetical protein
MSRHTALYARISEDNKAWLDGIAKINQMSLSALVDTMLSALRREQDLGWIFSHEKRSDDKGMSTLEEIIARLKMIDSKL